MGYTTEFRGTLKLNKMLEDEDLKFLVALNQSRRMKRNLGPEFGVQGEFYVGGVDLNYPHDETPDVLDYNNPSSTQPSLWCNWVPTEEMDGLDWDGGEKAYKMENWIVWIINKYLGPRGYVVNGMVEAQGEEQGDTWAIRVKDNVVRIAHFQGFFNDKAKLGWVPTDWEVKQVIPILYKEVTKPVKAPKKELPPVSSNISCLRQNEDVYIRANDLVNFLKMSVIQDRMSDEAKNPVVVGGRIVKEHLIEEIEKMG